MTLVGTVWAPRGPSPMNEGGRRDNGLTTVIAVHPHNPDVVYQGTAGGGVWRTRDGGATWTPLFDRELSLGIGEPAGLAIDPSDADTIYIGTSGRVAQQVQAGLYKSTDGGATVVRLGSGFPADNTGNARQFFRQSINVIIVDPADPLTVYLSSSSGVFRSTDAGQNWTQATGVGADTRSLVLDVTSPAAARVLYAGVNGAGVLRSTDGGRTFTPILTAATAAVSAALAGGGFRKVVVALAPPTSPPAAGGIQVLYASLEGTGGAPDPVGLFLSTDAGGTWTQQGATGLPTRTQGGYSFHFAVDPSSPGDGATDTLWFGCVGQARSTDAGATFTGLSGLHADTHTWAFGPSAVYCGNDGGITRSTDGGATWTSLTAGGLQTGLFYNLDIRPDATASATSGALQDNEVETTAGATAPAWAATNGGDGWDVVYDGRIAGKMYATSGFWSPAPCTRVWRSTDDGATWPTDITPWGTTSDAGCYIAPLAVDPSTGDIVYASGNQNLWQSQDGGTTWRIIGSFPGAGAVAVAPTDGNSVVVAVGTQVFVSTDALGTATPTFTDITRNLPGRAALRAAVDPTDPTVVYVVLGGFDGFGPGQQGHVFRTTVAGTAWTDISPPVDVPHGAIALDGEDTPTTIYVGTDLGVLRSVDRGTSWTVLDDIHFPRAPVTDLVIGRGSRVLRAATYGRGVFELGRPDHPAVAVNLESGLDFGTVCRGVGHHLTLQVFNVGSGSLVIDSVQPALGSSGFRVLPMPGTPVTVRAGEEIDFTVAFDPTTPGTAEAATIRIRSNDPVAPVVDLLASGLGGVPKAAVVVPDTGDFGAVCVGTFVDRDLVVNNTGQCPLMLFGSDSSDPAFEIAHLFHDRPTIAPGAELTLAVRFRPQAFGSVSADLQLFCDDPDSPVVVAVRGEAPPPRLVTSIADSGDFGAVCVDDFRDEPLTIANAGLCPLQVVGVTSSSPAFLVPDVDALPLTVAPGTAVDLQVRFQPSAFGPASATITVDSDDPAGPHTVPVSGRAPSGTVTVTGITDFGAVELGTRALLTLAVCNTGGCDLHVTRVAFRPPCPCDEVRHRSGCGCGCGCGGGHGGHGGAGHARDDQCCLNLRIVDNPFPAVLHPGACLGVQLSYVPTCDNAACCELVVESDDPTRPVVTRFVTGHLKRTLRSALTCWAAQELRTILDAGGGCR